MLFFPREIRSGSEWCRQIVFFIRNYILHFPFNFFDEGMFPDMAVSLNTNGAATADAMIGVYEKFHSRTKFFFDEDAQVVHFCMCFTHIQVPGNGHVAIHM